MNQIEVHRCPECGLASWEAESPGAHKASSWFRFGAIATVFASAVVVAILLWIDTTSVIKTDGETGARVIGKGIPVGETERIRDLEANEREQAMTELAASIGDMCESTFFHVGETRWFLLWNQTSGVHTIKSSRGWLVPIASSLSRTYYEDPLKKTNQVPWKTNPTLSPMNEWTGVNNPGEIGPRKRWSWSGEGLAHMPPPEEMEGRFVTTHYNLGGLAFPVAVGLAVYWLVHAATGLLALTGRFAVRRRSLIASVSGALSFAALIAISLTHVERTTNLNAAWGQRVGVPGSPSFGRFPNGVQFDPSALDPGSSDFSETELVTLLDSIQPVAMQTPWSNQLDPFQDAQPFVLCVAAVHETRQKETKLWMVSENFNLLMYEKGKHMQHPDFGPGGPVQPTGMTMVQEFGGMVISAPSADGMHTFIARVSLQKFVLIAAGVLGVGVVVRLVQTLVRVVVGRRRRKEKRCVACGYSGTLLAEAGED